MRTARFAAAVGAAALVLLGVTACDDGGSATPSGGAAATSELNGIQSTLDSIGSDIAGDGSP
ncbi:hypothetical protein OG943_21130 [Amycolatopsis sp. NBC_00345]|uniref:hypothetical protein n=1 Tax=Amycolatopsis sp. NBC_00345 TaxID=2975955 RepID=UPI002E268117